MNLSPAKVRSFRRSLLTWYDANKRALPWRGTRDPYKIWVSEIMLQQTRVAAAIDYYNRFLKQFPTTKALARASEQHVLAQWSGLGYYRRARMLHAAAKRLTGEKRALPQTSAELRELPGIGRYTAAAIASIAFNEPVAVVDGNVERVLLRVVGKTDPWRTAQQLLDPRRPGDFNQAMMELGATVCLPRNPLCHACSLRKMCLTRGEHGTSAQPAPRRAVAHYVLASDGKCIALVQRPKDARLMAGMWELPPSAAKRKPFLTVRHAITTTNYTVHVSRGKAPKGSVQLTLKQAARLPLTGLTRKVLKRLELLADQE